MAVVEAMRSGELVEVQVDRDVAKTLRRLGRLVSVGSHGYAQVYIDGKVTLLHRWVMGCTVGDGIEVDHRDRDRLNCRRSNLRATDRRGNNSNMPTRARSGRRGVYPNKNRWMARGKLHGRVYHLGTYDTVEQAAAVADAWRARHMPTFVPETQKGAR